MDLGLNLSQNPLIFFFLVIIVVVVFLSYYSDDMYLFAVPIVTFLVFLSYNDYIQSWIWIAITLAASFWFTIAALKGGSK